MKATVKQLFFFPVKALRGIAIESAELTPQGFLYDRHWMIVKPDGGFITQRQQPQMVLIHTVLTKQTLILKKAGMQDLIIPLEYFQKNTQQGNTQKNTKAFTAKIWKDSCQVLDEGEAASDWLTKAIAYKAPLRLVRMHADSPRPQSKPELLGADTHTLFADAAPYLVCNQSSLESLNDSMSNNDFDPVTMEHFRPNIVLEGLNAFQEHQIHELNHDHYSLKHCYPCQRCAVPTIDIDTGRRHPQQQPFSVLADINSMPDNKKAPAFGENAILSRGNNQTIRVGDQLLVSGHL